MKKRLARTTLPDGHDVQIVVDMPYEQFRRQLDDGHPHRVEIKRSKRQGYVYDETAAQRGVAKRARQALRIELWREQNGLPSPYAVDRRLRKRGKVD